MAHETVAIVLEAALTDYSPALVAKNPFKGKQKRQTRWRTSSKQDSHEQRTVGRVQLVKRTATTSSTLDTAALASASPRPLASPTYWLRFIDVQIRNEKSLPCFVLLSRSHARDLSDEKSVKVLEANAETVLLDCGPDGQWRGCHLPATFEQELCVFDPLAFASVVVCKPSAAKPPSVLPVVFAYGAFESYTPPQKSPEQIALEMEALSAKLLGAVMEIEQEQLQGDEELSLDALQRNAKQLFRMFDQDKSNSIDFDEYRQMLAYRKVHLIESKAKRFFQLVDDQKKGYIDEREFVIALYITNYMRLHSSSPSNGSKSSSESHSPLLSPVDVFYQLDADRDELLNVFEYEKALELLGVSSAAPGDAARVRRQFPKNSPSISLEQFKTAWLQLVDVKSELRKRDISTEPSAVSTLPSEYDGGANPAPALPLATHNQHTGAHSNARHEQDASAVPSTATTSNAVNEQRRSNSIFTTIARMRAKKTNELDELRSKLLDAITREEQAELQVALRAKAEVIALEKARRDAEQEAKRQLYNQQRHMATSTRTHEALRERQNKISRKKERVIKERQAKEERRLLAQIADASTKRKTHEMQAVQEHMASKMDKIVLQKAKCGDDVLDLCNQQLVEFPASLFHGRDAINALSSLLILNISKNRLECLPRAIFSHLFSLQALDVSENALTDLPTEIGDARDLLTLDLHSNALASVPEQLKNLRHLKVLNLACNHLTTFGACCNGLEALEELNLASNRLTSLSESIGYLSALQTLRLRGNTELKLLPRNLQQLGRLVTWDFAACEQKRIAKDVFGPLLANLRVLSLAHNALASLPTGIGKIKTLQDLSVARNALVHFPPQLCDLRDLVVLDASHNALEALPDELGQLLSLETLVLANNRLVALPPTIGLLTRLQRLDVRHNRLQSVPLELGALVDLRELDASWNEITVLPEEIGCLSALRQLDVSHNRIAHLPEAIMLWQSLETLRCSHNWLTTPLTPSLRELAVLQYVDLSHNQLTHLEPCLYELARLEVLNLAGNQLAFLPKELASACCCLKKLDLYNNRLAALPVEMAQLLPRLDVFSIERNPMKFLPDKWSDRWRLQDQYSTSFAKGYTPTEVHEWVRDQSLCYPAIVRVWKELAAASAVPASVTQLQELGHDSSNDKSAREQQVIPDDSRHGDVALTSLARYAVGGDEFLRRVRATMDGEGAWQNRFERLVRHYYYEFKHLGHVLVFEDVPTHEREQLAAIESERHELQQQRARDAISENNAFRAHVERSYRVDLDYVLARGSATRQQHERSLLAELRHETQGLNDIVTIKYAQSLVAREQRLRNERAQFAVEMKRIARERQQQRLARCEASLLQRVERDGVENQQGRE